MRTGRATAPIGQDTAESLSAYTGRFHRATVAACSVSLVFVLLQLAAFQRVYDYGGDAPVYLGLARSLTASGQYVFNYEPHVKFPPGLPFLLAVLSPIPGDDYTVGMCLMAVCSLVGLIAAYRLLHVRTSRTIALASVLLVAASPLYFQQVTRVLGADLPLFAVTMLALLACERVTAAQSRAAALLLVLLVPAALMLRTAGVTLLAAIGVWFVWGIARRATRRSALLLIPAIAAGILAQAGWSASVKGAQEAAAASGMTLNTSELYTHWITQKDPHRPELGVASVSEIGARVARKLFAETGHLIRLVAQLGYMESKWYTPLIVIALAAIVSGVLVSARFFKCPSVVDFYFMAYIALYAIWPFDEGVRFMLPVAPLAVAYIIVGAGPLGTRVAASRRSLLVAALLCCAVLVAGTLAVYGSAPSKQTLLSLATWGIISVLLVAGAVFFRSWRTARWAGRANTAAAAACLLLVVVGTARQVQAARRNLAFRPEQSIHAPTRAGSLWLAANTDAKATIMAQQVPIVHQITGRRAVVFPALSDAAQLADGVLASGATHLVVVDPGPDAYVHPPETERMRMLQSRFPNLLTPVHVEDKLWIFSIARPANHR